MNRIVRTLAACALAATAFTACDDGESDPGFSSGFETEKTVSSLTDAEGQQYCDAIERSFSGLVSTRKTCELGAVFFTEDTQSCNFFADQCVQSPPEPEAQPEGVEPEESECLLAVTENREGCEETVETLDGCINSIRSLTRSTLAKIGCGDAGNQAGLEAKFADLPTAPAEVPGCESVATNCPKLFEDGGPMDMVMGQPMGSGE